EVHVRQRPRYVSEGLGSEVRSGITRLCLLFVRVVQQLDEPVDSSLIALLLEVGPGLLVHGHPIERGFFVDQRTVIGADRAIEVVRAAFWIDLIEMEIAELPPNFCQVARLLTGKRVLRQRLALSIRIDEGQLFLKYSRPSTPCGSTTPASLVER